MNLRHVHLALPLLLCSFSSAQNHPVPLIEQPDPVSALPGSPSFTLRLRGGNFERGSIVTWDSHPRKTRLVSTGELTAEILASDIRRACTASIQVFNPEGGRSNTVFFPVRETRNSVELQRRQINSHGSEVAVGDFNRDGKLDLAIDSNYPGSPGVNIFLGNGDGSFRVPVNYATVTPPAAMAVGDFNRDGILDLVVTDGAYPLATSVLLGNGDGTFQPRRDIPNVTSPVTVGDFNRDGKLDLVLTDSQNKIVLVLGNGDGTFRAPVQLADITPVSSLVVGDFNGDGILDVGAGSLDRYVARLVVLLGKGDGTFQSPIFSELRGLPFHLIAADLNGDGKIDLIADTSLAWNEVNILLGNGDGTFSTPPPLQIAGGGFGLAVGDFNGDGKIDIAVANNDSNSAFFYTSILLGNGDGSFESPVNFSVPGFARGLATGFFSGHGNLDLVVGTDAGANLESQFVFGSTN